MVPDGGASGASVGCIPTARCIMGSGGGGTCETPSGASCP
jgi:hypothetical protein